MGESMSDYARPRKVLRGPFELFDKSIVLEVLEAEEELDATTLLRVTYKAHHPLTRKGRGHPQVPPLHVHFDQIETFKVLSGRMGVVLGYDQEEIILTPEDVPYDIVPMIPHQPFPFPRATEDTVMLMWAHPSKVAKPMDDLFFEHLLRFLSDSFERRGPPDILWLMLTQHQTGSALVMFPGSEFLGSWRWWMPWKIQAGVAWLARMMGYQALRREYMKD